jgi:hypothetical protein
LSISPLESDTVVIVDDQGMKGGWKVWRKVGERTDICGLNVGPVKELIDVWGK